MSKAAHITSKRDVTPKTGVVPRAWGFLVAFAVIAGSAGLWPLSALAESPVLETSTPESSASPAVPSSSAQPVLEVAAPAVDPVGDDMGMDNDYAKPDGPGAAMGSAGKSAANGIAGQTPIIPEAMSQGMDGIGAWAIQPDGTQGMPLGMDVSGWQPTVDWASAWNNGARFAYIKASEGPWTMNDYFAQQYNGSAAVGMVRGAYHFARPHISGGKNQAEVFVQSGGGWSADGKTLPGVLDLEAHVPVSESDKVGTCYDMTPTQLVAWARDFTSTYKNLTSRDAVIYSSYSFWQGCMGSTTAFSATNPLWIAAYGPPLSGVLMPGGWNAFTFWQYADAGTFPGDQNVFNGTYDQLKKFVGGAEVPAPVTVKDVVAGKDFDGNGVPDVIATKSDGTLWFYPGTGAGAVGAGRKIGSGWNVYDSVAGVGDFNKDGKNDLVARKIDGSLWFYAGTGVVNSTSEGYRGGVKVGQFGWDVFTEILGVGDFNTDGNPDLLATRADGTLWFYPGLGTGQPGAGRQIGSGWNIYDQLVAPGDFDLDGKADVIARKTDGSLWHYAGTGVVNGASEGYRSATKIGAFGWNAFSQIVGAGDANRDGKNDLMARSPDGSLWFYPGTGMRSFGLRGASKIGLFGWDAFNNVVAGKDFDGNGVPDVIATKSDGTLWFYPGTGAGAVGAGRKIGSGWNVYDSVAGVGDFNKDGKNDLVARKIDGSLWFYAGTGVVNSTSEGYRGGVKVGQFGWDVFTEILGVGDFNTDGNPDLLATRADGTLWFYPGLGTGQPGAGRQIGSGWNIYDQLVAPGDFDLDGKADVIARKTDGSLWHYAGTGVVNGASEGYRSATKIGAFGWNAFSQIVGAGDANRDGKNDLMARSPDGSLWFYPGFVDRISGYGAATKAGTL